MSTQKMARVLPASARLYPAVRADKWYPVLRRDLHVAGFFIQLPAGGFDSERFVWDKDFETKEEG